MKRIWIILFAACASLFLPQIARAQGVGASGDLTGTISDPSGAAVANAKVTIAQPDRGFQRVTTTDQTGEYRFTGLAPANYEVTIAASGFETVVQKGVAIAVGQITVADFQLGVSSVQQEVTVTGAAPTVNVEQAQQANSISDQYITDLPINRRDYLTFTLLAPGVSNSTRLASDQDFRVKQTPQSGLSFYGSNGRGNSVTVDGSEANDDSGGVRLNVSQDAVQEFQINRSNYSADLGGASGASINIVTKSGTNNLHGSLYGYFRNDALDARDPFAFDNALSPTSPFSFTAQGTPVKNSLGRQQFGGTAGFPIKKDKTFLFVSFEGLHADSQNAVPLLTNSSIFAGPTIPAPTAFPASDPRAAQQAIVSGLAAEGNGVNVPCLSEFNPGAPPTIVTLPAAVCAGALETGLTVSPLTGLSPYQNLVNNFLIGQLEANGGLFSYNTREYLASARLDHQFGEHDQAFLRYDYGHDTEQSPDVQSLTGFSAGSSLHTYDNTLDGSWFHEFSATAQNEARVQFDYNYEGVIPNQPGEVGLQIPGVASLGTNIFLPNRSILRRYEFADNVTLSRGHHTFKFGADELLRGDHSEAHTYMPGRFIFGTIPGGALSPCLQVPADCGLATAFPAAIDPLQAASLGAPIFLEQGFGSQVFAATRPYTALYGQDSWQVVPNFTFNFGLRYEMDSEPAPLNSDYNNVAPRISFAWDPLGDHKTVIRAGYGIYYGTTYFQIPDVDNTLGVLNANSSSVENQGPASQVLNAIGTCGIQNFVPPGGNSPCKRKIGIYIVPLTGYPATPAIAANPNPTYTSATVFGGLFGQGLVQCTTPAAGNAACITPAALSPLIGVSITNSGPIPPASVLFVEQRKYQDPYSQQAEFGIEREISPGLSVSGSFIYSHTIRLPVALDTNILPAPTVTLPLANGKTATYRDWNTNPAADPYSILTGQPSPCAGANVVNCFVNPLIVQNNQYSSAASALYEGGIFEVKKQYSNYFTLMASYTYSKAFDTTTDFNSDYSPPDQTNLRAERALSEFDQRHKVVIAAVANSPWKETILSGFQLSPIFTYNSGHPFNLLAGSEVNGDNHPTNDRPIGAARNTGLGPDFINFDLGLTWRYHFSEARSLQFMAQAFNLFNRTNFASVNNVVGPFYGLPAPVGSGATTFNVHGIRPGTLLPGGVVANPSTPLTFTSDFPKREIQLAMRFEF